MLPEEKLTQFKNSDSVSLSIEYAVEWSNKKEPNVENTPPAATQNVAILSSESRNSALELPPNDSQNENISRLMLPPIQRSLVWTNTQIINYWDSLLRGYPGGTMLVHQLKPGSKGIDFGGETCDVGANDYLLFDGQQRMSALLLGYAKGPLCEQLRLWVDLGKDRNQNSDLMFQFRVTSTGQPFGYHENSPNQKIELSRRRDQWIKWNSENNGESDLRKVFKAVRGEHLLGGMLPVEFSDLLYAKTIKEVEDAIAFHCPGVSISDSNKKRVNEFFEQLGKLKESVIIFQKIPEFIIKCPENYSRFFARLGQGGTRLSDSELAYSFIKYEIPEVREGMQNVVKKSGRLASDVDLALAGLRVTKMELSEIDWGGDWEKCSRPNPVSTLAVLRDSGKIQVRNEYQKFICAQDDEFNYAKIVSQIRNELKYDEVKNSNGLPNILLAQLPKALIEVLVFFIRNRDDKFDVSSVNKNRLIGFVLAWLGFVHNHDKAADAIFCEYSDSKQKLHFGADNLREFFELVVKSGVAYQIPHAGDIKKFSDDLIERKAEGQLRSYNERFLLRPIDSADSDDRKLDFERIGATLRVLSSDRNSIKRILLWLQRKYIQDNSPNYDPTSERDEDLPIDLDHVIPNSNFGYDWRNREANLATEFVNDAKLLDYFRSYRSLIGNSLGNFRWLDSSENRGRGDSGICINDEAINLYCFDSMDSIHACDRLIFENRKASSESLPWTKNDVANFQFLIDARTLFLIKKFIIDSGIEELVHPATDSSPDHTASATT